MSLAVFSVGGYTVLTFNRPTNLTDAQAYFATGFPGFDPEMERLVRMQFSGVNGQLVKRLGNTPDVLQQVGWIEGSTLANLQTARALLEGYAKDQVAGTLTILDATRTISNAIMTSLKWGRHWGHAGRYCVDYQLIWEATG